MVALGRYCLTANGQRIATGALALVVAQAATLAANGQAALVTDIEGRAARIVAEADRIECRTQAPTELFPTYNPTQTPPWIDRARQLLNEHTNTKDPQ